MTMRLLLAGQEPDPAFFIIAARMAEEARSHIADIRPIFRDGQFLGTVWRIHPVAWASAQRQSARP